MKGEGRHSRENNLYPSQPVIQHLGLHHLIDQVGHVILGSRQLHRGVIFVDRRHLKSKVSPTNVESWIEMSKYVPFLQP